MTLQTGYDSRCHHHRGPQLNPRTSRRNAILKYTRLARGNRVLWHEAARWRGQSKRPGEQRRRHPANVHDKHPLPDLLHGHEQRVYGDSAYASQKDLIHSKAPRPATSRTVAPVRLAARSMRSNAARTATSQK